MGGNGLKGPEASGLTAEERMQARIRVLEEKGRLMERVLDEAMSGLTCCREMLASAQHAGWRSAGALLELAIAQVDRTRSRVMTWRES